MSLSFFLRDYLYFSLGGDRLGPRRTATNLFLVWFLGGLWHGAAWHFVAWGLYHGALVVSGRFLSATRWGAAVWRAMGVSGNVVATFMLVTLGWVLFRAADLDTALSMLRAMVVPGPGWLKGSDDFVGPPIALALLGAGSHLGTYAAFHRDPKRTVLLVLPGWMRPFATAAAAFVIIIFAGEARRFIYFNF
jgi:hypothetical protein